MDLGCFIAEEAFECHNFPPLLPYANPPHRVLILVGKIDSLLMFSLPFLYCLFWMGGKLWFFRGNKAFESRRQRILLLLGRWGQPIFDWGEECIPGFGISLCTLDKPLLGRIYFLCCSGVSPWLISFLLASLLLPRSLPRIFLLVLSSRSPVPWDVQRSGTCCWKGGLVSWGVIFDKKYFQAYIGYEGVHIIGDYGLIWCLGYSINIFIFISIDLYFSVVICIIFLLIIQFIFKGWRGGSGVFNLGF